MKNIPACVWAAIAFAICIFTIEGCRYVEVKVDQLEHQIEKKP